MRGLRKLEFGISICKIVDHEKMIKALMDTGVDGRDLPFITNLYWNQTSIIKINNISYEPLEIKRGVMQGCILSPHLFNLYKQIEIDIVCACN